MTNYYNKIGKLFDKVKIGVIILNNNPPSIFYSNDHFKNIANGNTNFILSKIFKEINELNKEILRNDLELAGDVILGYTIYKLWGSEYLIFLNDISYKQIFLENKSENHFYDRLSKLIAEIVHEIGNPLTSISTTLQVLAGNFNIWNANKSKEYILRAINEIERLSNYLKKMRDFSEENIFIEKRSISLASLVNRVINQNILILKERNITVSSVIDPSIYVLVDEDAFYQVLLNLFFNSIDVLNHLPNPQIWIEIEEVNEFFVKAVYKNNGPPIPNDIIEKIFMPFYTTKKKGSGIGLAISLKLMTRMGGKIQAEPLHPNRGSRFTLYIPISEEN